jgi:hypothetical protein
LFYFSGGTPRSTSRNIIPPEHGLGITCLATMSAMMLLEPSGLEILSRVVRAKEVGAHYQSKRKPRFLAIKLCTVRSLIYILITCVI